MGTKEVAFIKSLVRVRVMGDQLKTYFHYFMIRTCFLIDACAQCRIEFLYKISNSQYYLNHLLDATIRYDHVMLYTVVKYAYRYISSH